MTLEKLPPVLVLHLKRFVYEKTGGCQKLVKSVEYPVDLEISKGNGRGWRPRVWCRLPREAGRLAPSVSARCRSQEVLSRDGLVLDFSICNGF